MKQRRRAKRLKWMASQYPAMSMPLCSYFISLPASLLPDLLAPVSYDSVEPLRLGVLSVRGMTVGAIDLSKATVT